MRTMPASETHSPPHGHAQPHLSVLDSDLGRNPKDPDQIPGRCLIQVLGRPTPLPLLVQSRVYIVSPRKLGQSWRFSQSVALSLVLLALWTGAGRRWTPSTTLPPFVIQLVIASCVLWAYTRWQAGRAVVAEKLTVIRGVGFQTESILRNGSSTNHLFMPMSIIRSVFIHEVMTRWHFKFVLAGALSDVERPIHILFEGQDLRLWQLQALYNDILDVFQLDQNGHVPAAS